MSIQNELARLRRSGDLVWLPPKRHEEKVVRRVFLAADVYNRLLAPREEEVERMAFLRADLDRFTTGGFIVVGNKRHKTCLLKQMDPPDEEVWEIRSRQPRPSLRLLGGFAATDCFVCLSLHGRDELGKANSREWRDAINQMKAQWRRFFLTYKRYRGDRLNDYISQRAQDERDIT